MCMCILDMSARGRVRRNGATLKRERLGEIHDLLVKPGALPMAVDHYVAICEYYYGLTKKKTIEYLTTLEELRFVLVEGKTILKASMHPLTELDESGA